MKATVAAILIVALFATVAFAQKPKTVDEAVQVLKTKWLKANDRDWILRNPKDEVQGRLYMGFGTGMRNEFGLWGDNQALRDSCGTNNPEGCSVVIIDRLWEAVRADADPAIVHQLDCQFQLTQTIRVSLKGFNQVTTREMIKRLQSQIDIQLAKSKASQIPSCQSTLALEVAGDPDLSCFVVAPHRKEEAKYLDDLTLDEALRVLGVRNLFRTVHYPPKIAIDFYRRCQFPKPFPD